MLQHTGMGPSRGAKQNDIFLVVSPLKQGVKGSVGIEVEGNSTVQRQTPASENMGFNKVA